MRVALALLAAVPTVIARPSTLTHADTATAPTTIIDPSPEGCRDALRARGVAFHAAERLGIANGVQLDGPLAGLTLTAAAPLVLDCSLVVSLTEAAPYLLALGLDHAHVSSGYSRRNVRGTTRPSKHSYGLAVDVSALTGAAMGTMRIDRDYEQGLGDDGDCVGSPVTEAGAALKIAQCQLVRSGLFYLVLSPDYDDAHHDHFHLEAKPWGERATLRSPHLAIH